VAHTCNPSYLAGWHQEDRASRPTWANTSPDPISKITRAKMNWRCGSSRCASDRVPGLQALSSNPSPTKNRANVGSRSAVSLLYNNNCCCYYYYYFIHPFNSVHVFEKGNSWFRDILWTGYLDCSQTDLASFLMGTLGPRSSANGRKPWVHQPTPDHGICWSLSVSYLLFCTVATA
jgi:hypothetical protein